MSCHVFNSIFLFVRIMRKVVGGGPNLCPAYTSLVFRLHQSPCWHVLPRNSLIKVAFTLPLKTSTELNIEIEIFIYVLPWNSLIKVTSTFPLKIFYSKAGSQIENILNLSTLPLKTSTELDIYWKFCTQKIMSKLRLI